MSDSGSSSPPLVYPTLSHDNQGPHLVVVIWVLISIATIFLGLRLYCKWLRHRGLWWDDYILIAAWICSIVESAFLTVAVAKYGYGLHSWDLYAVIPLAQEVLLLRYINLAGTFSVTAAIWSKTSFAITLLRLTEKKLKLVVWAIIITMNIAMGGSALLIWVQCNPPYKSWNFLAEGTCWPTTVLTYYDIFSAAYSAAMDIALAMLPWKLIWGLNMKREEKIGVAFAMSCGIFAGVTAIVKTTKIPAMLDLDPASGVDLFIWGNAETAVTIVAASIPILRVLVRDARTTAHKYYVSNTGRDQTFNGPSRKSVAGSQNNTVIVTARRARGDGSAQKLDNWSEKSILANNSPTPGHIMQTNEVAIDYHDRKDGEVVEYQMENLTPV